MEELKLLVTCARSGDLDAYGTIVRRFQNMAYGYAYSILGDFHLAEDAAQEAFFDAYRKLKDLHTPEAFAGWLRRIVFKHCDRLTRSKRIPTMPLEAAAELASGDPGPDEIAEQREIKARVIELIRSLPEDERAVTTLFYIDDYSQKEVAEFLGVPVTTVKNRLHASRNRLKQRMMNMVDEALRSFPLPERFADVVAQMNFVARRINPLADRMRAMRDAQLREKSAELRRRLAGGGDRDAIKAEAFALVREATRRAVECPHYDVQLVSSMILDEGWVAEIASGEGKTLSCLPAVYMAVLEGMRVHIITGNNYLAKRDAELAEAVFSLLGVTVGCIADIPHIRGEEAEVRREAYRCNITYGPAPAFGFDYLRDSLESPDEKPLQTALDFAVIDEVDSVLIDEARTPMMISGRGPEGIDRYRRADEIACELIERSRSGDGAGLYEVGKERRLDVHLTEEGAGAVREIAGIGSDDEESNAEWTRRVGQALRAHLLYKRDRLYVVRDGRVVILNSDTGRLQPGREYSDGLHQAIEAREDVEIRGESQEKISIRMQDYFRRYRKLAGMTVTAVSRAEEFRQRYNLDVAAVPTRRPLNRVDYEDRVYPGAGARAEAVLEEIRRHSRDLGRPVLVGTTGIRESEALSNLLAGQGIAHQVLNARPENAAREAEIVASAGQQHPGEAVGRVTIATEMAGRGTDIQLGPGVVCASCRVPPAGQRVERGVEEDPLFPPGAVKCCMFCTDYDEATGCADCFKPKTDPDFPNRGRTACRKEPPCGLHVVGAGRHPLRRIDNQLRNRSGRQGEPGSSRFFLSADDELMATVTSDLGDREKRALKEGRFLEGRRVSRAIERAQEKAEARDFEIRYQLDRLAQDAGDG